MRFKGKEVWASVGVGVDGEACLYVQYYDPNTGDEDNPQELGEFLSEPEMESLVEELNENAIEFQFEEGV